MTFFFLFFFSVKFLFLPVFYLRRAKDASLRFSCMQLEDIVVFSGPFNTALTS